MKPKPYSRKSATFFVGEQSIPSLNNYLRKKQNESVRTRRRRLGLIVKK